MRDRIDNQDNFASVGVPTGIEGQQMRHYLSRQELIGECRVEYTNIKMRHQDGLLYEEVKISSRRTDPSEIAQMALGFVSEGCRDWAFGTNCISCKGKGCPDCGYTGQQG